MTVLDLAFACCPRAFRREYEDQIRSDLQRTDSTLVVAADIAVTGLALRVQSWFHALAVTCHRLARAPLFSLSTVAITAISVALNIAVAAVIDNVLVKPLPYSDASRLVFAQETNDGRSISYPNYLVLSGTLTGIGDLAISSSDSKSLLSDSRAVALTGGIVSANYFSLLGVQAVEGSLFANNAESAGDVVISYRLWQRELHGATDTVGSMIRLGDRSYRIAGIAPAGFQDPTPYGLVSRSYWLALDSRDPANTATGNFSYNAIARFRDGVNVAFAQRKLVSALMHVAAADHLCCASVLPLKESLTGSVRPLLWLLYAASTTVLLIGCVNIANLVLTRNAHRAHELGVRAAVGASPAAITAELSLEMLVLAMIGALIGVSLAVGCLVGFNDIGQTLLPRWQDVGVTVDSVLYVGGLTCVVALVCGILPAILQSSDLSMALEGRTPGDSRRAKAFGNALVIIEIALTVPLLMSAALLVRSLYSYTHVELGFAKHDVDVIAVGNPPRERYGTDAAQRRFVHDLITSIQKLRGVESVAASLQTPFTCCASTSFTIPGRSTKPAYTSYNAVSPSYFQTLSIPLILGRPFNSSDRDGAARVAIVDMAFVRRYFGSVNVLGASVRPLVAAKGPTYTIIGVVGSVRSILGQNPLPTMYVPLDQDTHFSDIVLRTRGKVADLAPLVQSSIANVDPQVPAPDITSMQSLFSDQSLEERARSAVFMILGALSLILTTAGIFAVTAYAVERRTHEFGIRRAVGASTSSIVGQIVMTLSFRCFLGIIIGGVIAAASAGQLERFLFETSPFDLATFCGVSLLVFLTAAAASSLPAWRALRAEPIAALRRE